MFQNSDFCRPLPGSKSQTAHGLLHVVPIKKACQMFTGHLEYLIFRNEGVW